MLFGGYYAAILIVIDFFPRFLKDFGYSDFEIGIAVMWYMFSCLLSQLVFGYLIDKFNISKQIIISVFIVMMAGFPLLFNFSDSRLFVTAFSIMAIGPWRSLGGVWDSWVARLGDVDYGKARAAGAIAYAVSAIVLGQAFAAMGNMGVVFSMAGIFIIILWVLSGTENPRRAGSIEKMTIRTAFTYFKGNRHFLFMLAGSSLSGVTLASVLTYLPILMAAIGGTQAELGIALFIMGATDFLVMMQATGLKKRLGSVFLLIFGFFGFFAKNAAFAMSSHIWQIYLFCMLQSVSIALVIPGMVLFLTERVDHRYLASALLVNQSVTSISMMIANPLCGLLSERLGVGMMLMIAGLPAFLAGMLFLFMRKKLSIEPEVSIQL